MHCPKCGQQQLSEEVRFCSRCGFLLEAVTMLVAHNGMIPALMHGTPARLPKERTARQIGIRQGAKLVFWSVALFPIFFGIALAADGPGPLVVPFTLFLAGIMRMLYARLFGEDVPPAPVVKGASGWLPQGMRAGGGQSALPPSQSAPVPNSFMTPRTNTAEIVQPPSVTEQTTRLLDDQ